MKTLGDLLILFDPEALLPMGRLRNSDWWRMVDGYPVWNQSPIPGWKGYPFQNFDFPDGHVIALGELPNSISWASLTQVDADDLTQLIAGWTGSFLLFAWQQADRTWHAWTDRFGTLHAYHAWNGTWGALGTFSPAVAASASQRDIDWQALAGWFSFGFFPGDRTHYTDVRILRPATHYTFDASGQLLNQQRYWRWKYQPDEKRSYQDTVQEFGKIFETVIDEAVSESRVALPISGGLDSRSTVAALSHEMTGSGRLWSYSYGYSADSVETKIARQIALARDLPFQAYTIEPYLFSEMERVLAYTEGFQDITQARQMYVRDELASHADTLIAALWGDVWLDDMGLVKRKQSTPVEVLQHTLRRIRKDDGWLLEHIALPQLALADAELLLEDFVAAELQPLEFIADPDFRVKAYKTEQWSFRWSVPPTRIFQSAAWPRKVFYDTRLADFFITVPEAFVSGRKLQIDYLKRFAPDLARISWQVYDADLYHYQHHNTWLLPKRILKKTFRTFRNQNFLQRNWEVQYLGLGGRDGLERWLVKPGLKLHEFISAVQLKGLIDDFYRERKPAQAYPISMLLTLSCWLEIYG